MQALLVFERAAHAIAMAVSGRLSAFGARSQSVCADFSKRERPVFFSGRVVDCKAPDFVIFVCSLDTLSPAQTYLDYWIAPTVRRLCVLRDAAPLVARLESDSGAARASSADVILRWRADAEFWRPFDAALGLRTGQVVDFNAARKQRVSLNYIESRGGMRLAPVAVQRRRLGPYGAEAQILAASHPWLALAEEVRRHVSLVSASPSIATPKMLLHGLAQAVECSDLRSPALVRRMDWILHADLPLTPIDGHERVVETSQDFASQSRHLLFKEPLLRRGSLRVLRSQAIKSIEAGRVEPFYIYGKMSLSSPFVSLRGRHYSSKPRAVQIRAPKRLQRQPAAPLIDFTKTQDASLSKQIKGVLLLGDVLQKGRNKQSAITTNKRSARVLWMTPSAEHAETIWLQDNELLNTAASGTGLAPTQIPDVRSRRVRHIQATIIRNKPASLLAPNMNEQRSQRLVTAEVNHQKSEPRGLLKRGAAPEAKNSFGGLERPLDSSLVFARFGRCEDGKHLDLNPFAYIAREQTGQNSKKRLRLFWFGLGAGGKTPAHDESLGWDFSFAAVDPFPSGALQAAAAAATPLERFQAEACPGPDLGWKPVGRSESAQIFGSRATYPKSTVYGRLGVALGAPLDRGVSTDRSSRSGVVASMSAAVYEGWAALWSWIDRLPLGAERAKRTDENLHALMFGLPIIGVAHDARLQPYGASLAAQRKALMEEAVREGWAPAQDFGVIPPRSLLAASTADLSIEHAQALLLWGLVGAAGRDGGAAPDDGGQRGDKAR